MTAVERMANLVETLPYNDQILANEFLLKRNFDSLQELVNSAIVITKKALKAQKEGVKINKEYLDADLDGMRELKMEVDNYVIPLQEGLDNYSENDIMNY